MYKWIRKYLLLMLAGIIFIVGTILYIGINTTVMSVSYMFLIFIAIALCVIYIYKKSKD